MSTAMPLEIAAVVIPGHGAASYAIAKQAPHLERYFPEITTCRHATINLQLGIPLQVRNPDIVTPPINWNDNPSGQGERFAITKIELSLPDDPTRYEAWIYIAEYSPHRFNDGVIEVLAKPLSGIAVGLHCKILVERCTGLVVI